MKRTLLAGGAAVIIPMMLMPIKGLGMDDRTKYSVRIDIDRTPEVKVMSHTELQQHIPPGFTGTLMEWVDAKLKVDSLKINYHFKNGMPAGLSHVELKLQYRGTIFMSDRIPNGSTCWNAVIGHATEHQRITVAGLERISNDEAEAILQRYTETMVNKFNNDFVRFQSESQADQTAMAVDASGEIQDKLFIPILKNSVAIDTGDNYRPLEALCGSYK